MVLTFALPKPHNIHMKNTGNIEFKPDLGYTPFHLGCNALFSHPNCGLCFPVGKRYAYRPIPNPNG